MTPKFFATPAKFRNWLERYHQKRTELWVGYYKKATLKPSITWPESVDQALCFGWIDGIRKSLDEDSYVIRFTPRRAKSNWSSVNIRRIGELIESGLVAEAGLAAYARRTEDQSRRYAYEQGKLKLDEASEQQIRANKTAWKFFETLPPSVKKPTVWWVLRAKQTATRQRRLKILVECCERNERIPSLVQKRSIRKKK